MKNLFFFIGLFFSLSITAQSTESKSYFTQRVNSKDLKIDGILSEEEWQTVDWGGDFVQREPTYGIPPTQQTRFKILYDEKNLYVAIQSFDSEPEKIVERMSRRDGFEGDRVGIMIDSYFDKRSAFGFVASVSGVKSDFYISNNGEDEDETWDPIWYLATSIDREGWIAEARIPLSQLRFADLPRLTWGLQVVRFIFRDQERSFWQPIPRDAPGLVHLFGHLEGIEGVRPQKQLEIQPYILSSFDRYPIESENPFRDGKDVSFNVGADAKIGLTSDITLDLTVNPDFGQVEADPSQVNLSAFRLFFQERRPFFLEGNNILTFPLVGFDENNLFYSRQIGGTPSYFPEADYVDQPGQSRILGAAKITGKNSKGFSWGLLESVTRLEKAEISIQGENSKMAVEPLTNYLVARAQKDLNEGKTVFGGMVTQTTRDINHEHLDFLHRNATTAGLDLFHTLWDRKYAITARTTFSHVSGSAESITLTQMASERFFQRTDNLYRSVDSTRTHLTGSSSTLSFDKQSGKWIWGVGGMYRSPGLELNDAGFLQQTDNITYWGWMNYRQLNPGNLLRSQRINAVMWATRDFGLTQQESAVELNYNLQMHNLWWLGGGLDYQGAKVSNADLRGGPSIRYPGGVSSFMFISSNEQKKFFANVESWQYTSHNHATQNYGISLFMSWQPLNALRISASPSFSKGFDELQYVETIEDHNLSSQYILARVDQTTYRLTTRINYNITPNLTIEYWGQPFISSIGYTNYKKVLAPNASEYKDRFVDLLQINKTDEHVLLDENNDSSADYVISIPDFVIKQLRTNMVLRWEYIPGSTFFLVWSTNGSVFTDQPESRFQKLSADFLEMQPQNTFLVKYTYRFIL